MAATKIDIPTFCIKALDINKTHIAKDEMMMQAKICNYLAHFHKRNQHDSSIIIKVE